jgi:hypothetical protein
MDTETFFLLVLSYIFISPYFLCIPSISLVERPNSVLGKSMESVEPHQNIRHTVLISPHAISELFQP